MTQLLTTYSNAEFSNIICSYCQALYATTPANIRENIKESVKISCQTGEWVPNPSLPRVLWTIEQLLTVIADPWFVWDMENGCGIKNTIVNDIFGNNNFTLDPKLINPIVNTTGFSTEKLNLIKVIGGLYHYLFARTYYIDRCYGTQKYIEYYYNNSEDQFIIAHTDDFFDYVDYTGMIKGNKLLDAWRDSDFRTFINILDFIKPLAGLFCNDFWHWTNPNIYWWTTTSNWNGSWNDNLTINSNWYGNNSNTININESKLITTLNNNTFPGYRISVNDLYYNINNPESDTLASLFGNNLLKGPSAISNIPANYDESCLIEYVFENIPGTGTGIAPETIDLIKDVSIYNNQMIYKADSVNVFEIISNTTSTVLLGQTCDTSGQNMDTITEQPDLELSPPLPQLPCSDEIDIVSDIFIENLNMRVTKTRVKIVCITDTVNISSEIISTIPCDNNPIQSTMSTDWSPTGCDGSVYNDPDILEIPFVTDIYINNNGSLMQKKSTIKVLKKNNINDIIKPISNIFDCVGSPPSPIPAEDPLSNNILFDKSSWEYVPQPFKSYLDSAADRWNTYLKLDPTTVTEIRKRNKKWNGIRLLKLQFSNEPNNTYVAECDRVGYLNLDNNRKNTLSFRLALNSGRVLQEQHWINMITHELGHAIGIGTGWSNIDMINGTINGNLYPNTLSAYNNLINNNIQNNLIIPIENTGGLGTKFKHFENNTRTINAQNYPGFANEIMLGMISPQQMVISLLSIKNAVDIGYLEKNPGASEGNPTQSQN